MSDLTSPAASHSSHPIHHPPIADTNVTATATAPHPSSALPDSTITHPSSSPPLQQQQQQQQQPILSPSSSRHVAQGGQSAAASPRSTELARLKVKLQNGLRQFPDFPQPGVLFEDIMPLFASHDLHQNLITALELQLAQAFQTTVGEKSDIDVIVGLESRGFLFGPTLALKMGAGFVPVRKKGKLPGSCVTEKYSKEYGDDEFQMQSDAIQPGQKVVIVDDIIATGGTAAAAGKLVQGLGGDLLGYVFMMELDFLKGRDKLNAPVHTLFGGQKEGGSD